MQNTLSAPVELVSSLNSVSIKPNLFQDLYSFLLFCSEINFYFFHRFWKVQIRKDLNWRQKVSNYSLTNSVKWLRPSASPGHSLPKPLNRRKRSSLSPISSTKKWPWLSFPPRLTRRPPCQPLCSGLLVRARETEDLPLTRLLRPWQGSSWLRRPLEKESSLHRPLLPGSLVSRQQLT